MTDDEGTDRTVMVVDDEANLADLYATFLEPEYDVRTATSGSDALQKVDDAVDVVLLDRRMPDLSGDEVLGKLRERSLTVQVAMLTAVEPDVYCRPEVLILCRTRPAYDLGGKQDSGSHEASSP